MALTFAAAQSEYMSNTGLSDLQDATTFTYAFWGIIPAPGAFSIISHRGGSGDRRIYYPVNNNVQFDVGRATTNASAVSADISASLTSWHHLAFVFTLGSLPSIYLNGSEVSYNAARSAGSGALDSADGVFEVARHAAANYLSGSLAEIGIWNRALTAAEIVSLGVSNYSPVLIPDGLVHCWRLKGNTGTTNEPDYAGDNTLTLFNTPTEAAHQTILTRAAATEIYQPLSSSEESYQRGTILAQPIELASTNTLDKISVNLYVNNDERSDYILEENGVACWSAANFQEMTDRSVWTLYTNPATYNATDDVTESQGFLTNAITTNYTSADEVFLVAPRLTYKLFLGDGTYSVFCRCAGSGTFWFAWDDDEEPDSVSVSDTDVLWRKIGDFDLEEPGLHDFYVYAGSAASAALWIDQFRMVRTDYSLENVDLEGQDITYVPTKCPFNTFVRVRSLNTDATVRALTVADITDTYTRWSWLSSERVRMTGWHNYGVNAVTINPRDSSSGGGISLEYVVIDGNKDFNAQWVYTTSDTASNTYISTNYGSSFGQET